MPQMQYRPVSRLPPRSRRAFEKFTLRLRQAWSLPLVLTFGSACCPPCAEPAHAPDEAAPEGGQAEVAAAAAGAQAPEATPAPFAPSGTKIVLWDGEANEGKGQGWADCEDKANCKTQLEMLKDQGVNGTAAVHFRGEGSRWIGMGWNWFAWWPKDSGTDIRPYDTLRFSIRIVVADPNNAPQPAAMTVALKCSTGEKTSSTTTLERFLQNPGDGKWHDVEVPLAEFYKGHEGQAFDPKTVWELNLGTWAPHNRKFDIYLDDIAAFKK